MRVMAEKIGMIVALGRKMTDATMKPRFTDKFPGKGEGPSSSSECGIITFSFNPLSSSLEVCQNGQNCVLTFIVCLPSFNKGEIVLPFYKMLHVSKVPSPPFSSVLDTCVHFKSLFRPAVQ